MIKELLDGLKSRIKGVGEKGGGLPPAGGIPPAPIVPVESMPPVAAPTPAPSTEDFSALLGGGDTSELDNKVKALEDKTTKLEAAVRETLEMTKANKTRLDSIDGNMKKFLSLYELVTNQINPFVDGASPFRQKAAIEINGKTLDEPEEVKPAPKPKIVMPPAEELEKPKVEEPKAEEPETLDEILPEPPKHAKPAAKKVEPAPEAISDSEQVMFMQSVKDGNASFVLEWITSLVSEDGGVEKNTKLLRYLLDLGWITPKAYEALMQHMQTLAQTGRMPQERQRIPLMAGMPSAMMPQGMPMPGGRPMQMPSMPLTSANNVDSLMAVLDWVKYLVDKVGYNEATDVLKYLVQLEWITPEAHAALLKYIDKSMPPQAAPKQQGFFPQPKAESKVVLSPSRMPRPEDLIRSEYRIPIQPAERMQAPMEQPFQPQVRYSEPRRVEPRRQQANAIIPLTELGSDIDSLAIVLEWIRYLVDRAGTQGAKDVFTYYQNIGWVDQRVCQQLVKYVDGIKASEEETVGYQPSVEDHATSLFFISKLKHMDLSEEDISSMLGK
jgi:archaellum component FlaD/FlaE